MIKKAKSLLFSSRKNKDELKKEAKVNDNTNEQLLEIDNQPNNQFPPEKKSIEKPKDPCIEDLESLISLYSEGEFTEALFLINELLPCVFKTSALFFSIFLYFIFPYSF